MLRISLIVPTFNRARFLDDSLQTFVNQTLEPSSYEILVVDNNSTDDTKATVERALKSSPVSWSYLFEPKQGLHFARNRGIVEAKGDVIVFGDDDIIAEDRWLQCFAEEFERSPDLGVAGGPIVPAWLGTPEPWVFDYGTERNHPVFAILDLGERTRVLRKEHVFGCNFAIRRDLAIEIGGSQPDTFPPALIHLSGLGEYGMTDAVRRLGYDVVYFPKASVSHQVDCARCTFDYFRYRHERWAVEEVFSEFREQGRAVASVKLLRNAARRLLLAGRRSRGKRNPALFRSIERVAAVRTIRQTFRVLTDHKLRGEITKADYLEDVS